MGVPITLSSLGRSAVNEHTASKSHSLALPMSSSTTSTPHHSTQVWRVRAFWHNVAMHNAKAVQVVQCLEQVYRALLDPFLVFNWSLVQHLGQCASRTILEKHVHLVSVHFHSIVLYD